MLKLRILFITSLLPSLICTACTSDDSGTGTNGTGEGTGDGDGDGDGDADGTATGDGDATATGDGDGDGDATATGDGDGDSSGGSESTGTGGDGDGDVTCEPTLQSGCGNPNSIIAGQVSLDPGLMPTGTSGTLIVRMNHDALGDGASGGIQHTGTTKAGVDVAGGPVTWEFDFCTGGEMWSEENCGYRIHAFIDLNGNQVADAGEPAGTTDAWVSCDAETCKGIELNCKTGESCFSFQDPMYCGCDHPGGCNSPINACG